MNNSPIGIFDSGVGGLSVARSIRKLLPCESLLYYADSKHAPYGEKSQAFILARSRYITALLLARGAKAIVVACNTATVSTIETLRKEFAVPIIGVEPGVKPAIQLTKTGRIAVLATQYTADSDYLKQLVARHANGCEFVLQGCPGFVEQIENELINTPETEVLVRKYVEPLLVQGVDTFVMGCTHYTFLVPIIFRIAGESIQIIETQDAVAEQVGKRLMEGGLLGAGKGGLEVFSSSV
ncbi:glutamate racemase [Leucothrix arctica]|uniref:Glutamate racemase n=1 Tax=Leucothrix arctica TaxID=1481894 RepID=A0A317CGM0_9GAMM|nr:glutamate racemase [Leucothrix arctica]PWQ95362.1 glutamate racemase [Leucothrix arctica]